ncbi:Uncharacterised protein [uncultured archaeon]|nr:Uncharacterised protein [uncultured archaeon]
MINFIIVIILIVVAVVAIKMNHLRHKSGIVVLILIALFFYVTVTFVTNKNNIDLTTYDGFMSGMKVYGGWLVNGFQNIKSITGNAVKMDWTATNASISDNPKTNLKSPSATKASVTVHK